MTEYTKLVLRAEQLSMIYHKIFLASPDGSQVIRTIGEMQSPVWELFFSPDSALLAATDGIQIPIWRVEDETLLYIGKAACP
jgi:hypothetical protein